MMLFTLRDSGQKPSSKKSALTVERNSLLEDSHSTYFEQRVS